MALIEVYLRDADRTLLITVMRPLHEDHGWRWDRKTIVEEIVSEGSVPPSKWWDEAPQEPTPEPRVSEIRLAWRHLQICAFCRFVWPLFALFILSLVVSVWRR